MSKKEGEMTRDNPSGTGFTYLARSEWGDHWLLSRLNSGSGLDGDFAYFWTAQSDVSAEDLLRIVFQRQKPEGDWDDCPSCEGDFFPSRGSIQAVAGAYFDIPYPVESGTKYQALVPVDLVSPPD